MTVRILLTQNRESLSCKHSIIAPFLNNDTQKADMFDFIILSPFVQSRKQKFDAFYYYYLYINRKHYDVIARMGLGLGPYLDRLSELPLNKQSVLIKCKISCYKYNHTWLLF